MNSHSARIRRLAALLGFVLFAAPAAAIIEMTPDFERAMLAGQYERALILAKRLAEENPKSTIVAYNVGCVLSRLGEKDEAIRWLMRSAENGFSGVRSLETDEDLAGVRDHEGFAAVLERVNANVAERFERFKQAAREAEPVVKLPQRFDAKTPTPLIIALHGTGGDGAQMARLLERPAREVGAILIAPDALRPSGPGYSWTYRDESEWLVLKMIQDARSKWNVGPVILVGYSQGANIALAMGQTHPTEFAGVIPVAGHYEADLAEAPREGDRPRWCLLIGARDEWAKTYEAAEEAFEEAGMAVHRYEIPGMGHSFPSGPRGERMLVEALEWVMER